MNKPVYLGLSILETSKMVMYEFWYDYVKPKHQKAKLCYMDTVSFFSLHKNRRQSLKIVKDVEASFETSNYELDKPLPNGIGLMKDKQ